VDGTNRMKQLIDDLLAYSGLGSRPANLEPMDANFALDGALKNLEVATSEAGVSIEREPLPRVVGDLGRLIQVFQNLVENAIKYRGGQAPQVHIGAKRLGQEWVFFVRDNGIGIAPEYHERVFELFQRLHTHSEYSGTGLGLSLAKRIVAQHGGRIWVESEAGAGATFLFTLPCLSLPEAEEQAALATA